MMSLSSITGVGFTTSLLGATAGSITAGAVVGSFLAATAGFLRRRSRKEIESTALRDGYLGASIGIFCLIFDHLIG